MENEKFKQHNTSATVGFLLTLLNLVLSFAFAISGSSVLILIFTSSTALFSLILSIIGFSRSKTIGVGKILSISGIVINVLILTAVIALLLIKMFFVPSCSNTEM